MLKIFFKNGFIALLLIAGVAYTFIPSEDEKNNVMEQMTLEVLKTVHYSPQQLNDTFSVRTYALFVKRMDINKKYFIASDIRKLKEYRFEIDNDIQDNKFDFFKTSLEILNKRVKESENYYKDILSQPFNFKTNEYVELDSKKMDYASSEDKLKEEWRKVLKYQTMVRLDEMLTLQEGGGEKSDTIKIKPIEELEIEARKKVMKSYDDLYKRINEVTDEERFAQFLNCIANSYDPHTEFFPPKDRESFDIEMSGGLEGIGAQLQEKDGLIKVTSIVPGSASWKQGELKAGDIILKVAQGKDDPIDITGMRIDNVVRKIRGKKGTEVRLTVKKPDGSIIIISIIRDVVILEEKFAKSAVINTNANNGSSSFTTKAGYIRLPEFYADFNGVTGRYCAKDVKKEIEKLKQENIDGIVLDLRDNGGGSLQDVVDMFGLFINKGPVVQVKSNTNKISVFDDKDTSLLYGGPVVVMVNSNSASASEIMAAAMQDYKRGVIVGTQTFGKGTVQRFFNLDDYVTKFMSQYKPLGSVKISMQKFYRINGGTTQLKGVTPDVILPDRFQYIDEFEKDYEYAMPWDEIPSQRYYSWKNGMKNVSAVANSKNRVEKSEAFHLIDEQAKRLQTQKEKTKVSLNIEKYREEQKEQKSFDKKWEDINKDIEGMDASSLKADLPEITSDTAKNARTKEWLKNIRKDNYIFEAASVIGDLK